jgi:RimJ/RimL family protein N-acetyltransferase
MPTTYEISTDPGRLDVDLIHQFLASSYWAKDRPRAVVERSIAHSLGFGVYADGRQVGFARVATDRAVFAYLMDVFVLPEHRGRGVGKILLRAMLAHPDLQGLRLFALRTRDAHGLYAQFGFRPLADVASFMAIQSGEGDSDRRAPATDAGTPLPAAAVNELGQPIGPPVDGWAPPPPPPRESMTGRFCGIEPLEERFAADLHAANSLDTSGRTWTYLPYGPFGAEAAYRRWMRDTCFTGDPLFHAIVDLGTRRAVGVAAYMRVQPGSGSIEVGHVHFSPLLQHTRAATEAMYLMMRRVFELGYRRYEWKCDALNAPSRAAAERLGFSFEGIFRQATVYKGRSRDTAWYAVTDRDWPTLARAFDVWLDPRNFDDAGRQRVALSPLTRPLLTSRG